MVNTKDLLDNYKSRLINVTYRYKYLYNNSNKKEAIEWYKTATDVLFSFYWETLDEPMLNAYSLFVKEGDDTFLNYHNKKYLVHLDNKSAWIDNEWIVINDRVITLIWDWNYMVQRTTFKSYVDRVIKDISCVDDVVNEIDNEKLLEWEDD